MNTSQLECFVQVALNLNFRRAAEELHLSQPTVSKQIASLEAELGGSLFVRTTREVLLTSLGEAFFKDAQEILRLSYAAEERARRRASGDDLVIAYSDSNELYRLAHVLDAMRRERPSLHVQLRQGSRDGNIARLEREQVDVVLGFEPQAPVGAGLGFTRVATSDLSCVVRADSPLAPLDEVGAQDVTGLPQVLCLPPGMRRRGIASQTGIPASDDCSTHCATTSEAYALVDAGFGYALVPSIFTMPDPLHRAIPWKGHSSATYGIYHRVGSRGNVVPQFVERAREVYARAGFSVKAPLSL